jgi:hypothetical protein
VFTDSPIAGDDSQIGSNLSLARLTVSSTAAGDRKYESPDCESHKQSEQSIGQSLGDVRDPLRVPMPRVRENKEQHSKEKWRFWITKLQRHKEILFRTS